MEDGILILNHIKVENANAVAGVTWGFPAVTGFLGFVHALSRRLPAQSGLELTGCGIICHSNQVHAYQPGGRGDHAFALTRNPLTREAKSPSFTEEGRMHMDVSLVIPIKGDLEEIEDVEDFPQRIKELAVSQRLAGGTITDIKSVIIEEPPENRTDLQKYCRRWFHRLLPGFTLIQRSDLLSAHLKQTGEKNPDAEDLDAWLDFASLKYKAEVSKTHNNQGGAEKSNWLRLPKPAAGWLVVLPIGFRGISELYPPGELAGTRDNTTPFRFVESAYSVGEWLSPHRLKTFDQMIWKYSTQPESGWYLCKNNNLAN